MDGCIVFSLSQNSALKQITLMEFYTENLNLLSKKILYFKFYKKFFLYFEIIMLLVMSKVDLFALIYIDKSN